MRKGIAVPYIIAILLGIAVVAIIGYWFFFVGGSFGGELSAQDCQRKLTTYCTIWQTAGFTGTPVLGTWTTYAKGCTEINVPAPDDAKCKSVLGITAPAQSQQQGGQQQGTGYKTGCTAPTFLTGQGGCSACTDEAKIANAALENACNSCC